MKKTIRIMVLALIATLALATGAFAKDMTFQGKVVDADTLEPIEGAAVVGVWLEERQVPFTTQQRIRMTKEAVTDDNGEWQIKGPKGEVDTTNPYIAFALGQYILRDPGFYMYKPGYIAHEVGLLGNFTAFPLDIDDGGPVGIVLQRPGDTREELLEYLDSLNDGSWYLMPVKNPEKKLRDMDFSFKYGEDRMKIGAGATMRLGIRKYWVYTVVGMKKAKDIEQRKDVLRSISGEIGVLTPAMVELIKQENKEVDLWGDWPKEKSIEKK